MVMLGLYDDKLPFILLLESTEACPECLGDLLETEIVSEDSYRRFIAINDVAERRGSLLPINESRNAPYRGGFRQAF